MFDKLGKKLLGNEEERAVSPVIGVTLMMAITVILAAVIAAFVLDMGDSIDEEAQSAATMSFDGEDELSIELTSEGNADEWEIRGDVYEGTGEDDDVDFDSDTPEELVLSGAGDTLSLDCSDEDDYHLNTDDSGTITVIASNDGGDTWTNIAS